MHKSSINIFVSLFIFLVSIFVFVHQSVQLNKHEIWFSNMDEDSTMLVESMRINSGKEPQFLLPPALGTYYIYSKFLKFFDIMNVIPISEFSQLAASEDPLLLLPEIFYQGRTISIIISILCALIFGSIFYLLTEKLFLFFISTVLFLFSGGLFLHSLLIRTELISVFFVLLSWLLLIMYSKARRPSFLAIILAGVLFGFGVLTKIQVLPMFLFMIFLLIYIVFKKMKQSPESLLKFGNYQIFFVIIILSMYLFFLNLIYHVRSESSSIPQLLLVFLLLILLFSMLSQLILQKAQKISLFLNHTNLFLIGFLLSFVLAFHFTNISSDNGMRSVFDLVFQSGSQSGEIAVYLHSLHEGISGISAGFINFLEYYSLKSFLLFFLLLFFILTKKRIDYRAIFTFAFGIGYWVFSSLRHFGPHYLIYSDIFLYTSFLLILAQFLSKDSKGIKFKRHIIKPAVWKSLLILIPVLVMGKSQLNYVKREYQTLNQTMRNRLDLIPYCSPWPGNDDYSELMKNSYKSELDLFEKVYDDPYLNGSERGIDLINKINFKTTGWFALYDKPNLVNRTRYKIKDEDILNKTILTLLKNIYQSDIDKFNGIRETILKKGLGWSDEDVERRIFRENPSNRVNLQLNDAVEFVGFDLVPITKIRLEFFKNEIDGYQKKNSPENKTKANDISILKLGEEFELIFYWKCHKSIEHRYMVLVSMDKGYDSMGLGYENEYPTPSWRPGEVIKNICRFRVPEYLETGQYTFKVCLYDLDEEKLITSPTNAANINIFAPLEGAIQRYNALEFSPQSLNESIEIIKLTDDLSIPPNKNYLLRALKELEIYNSNDPQHLGVNYVLGMGYEKLGYFNEAEEKFNDVLDKDRYHSGALFHLSNIYYREKKYQLAADLLERIPLKIENNFEAGFLLLEVYKKLVLSDKAFEAHLIAVDKELQIISENSISLSKWNVSGEESSMPFLPWANANIGKKVFLYGESINLSLKIKGEQVEKTLPHLTIWLGNEVLFEGYLKDEEWNIFEFNIKDIKPGEHLLKIWKRGGGLLYLSQ